jgi:hypothetical protein
MARLSVRCGNLNGKAAVFWCDRDEPYHCDIYARQSSNLCSRVRFDYSTYHPEILNQQLLIQDLHLHHLHFHKSKYIRPAVLP